MKLEAFDLTGKVAIVTGSSKGIGRSIAEQLAQAGAAVVVSSRKAEACEPVAQAIRQAGGKAEVIPAHVGREEDRAHLVEETLKRLGRLDVLVCNAAANPYYGPLARVEDAAYHKTMDTNVLGALRLSGLAHPHLIKQGGGSIIFVASIAGLRGVPNLGSYSVSKAAMIQLARSLAVDWGRDHIRVNCILPGLVKTDFARALWENPALAEEGLRRNPLGRLGEPDDIGPAAVFLASRAGAWVTGSALVIDGGTTIME